MGKNKKKFMIISLIILSFLIVLFFGLGIFSGYIFKNISENIIKSDCSDEIDINKTKCISGINSILLKIYLINNINYSKKYKSIWFNWNLQIFWFFLPWYEINYMPWKYKDLTNNELPKYENKNWGYRIEKKYNDDMALIRESY